jgi:hypothetical protein
MSKTDADDEAERIDQLEAVVREQQRELEALAETLGIENPREEAKKYSRRGALALGAAGVAGAAGYATGSAQAQQQAAGTIGDGDEAVDVQSVNTDEALVGTAPQRPLISESDTTVNVPADYGTVQAAIDDCPIILRHEYEITVDDGDYSSEDIHIENVYAGGEAADGLGEQMLRISGNSATPSNVKFGSLFIHGVVGKTTPLIEGFQVERVAPRAEKGQIACHGAHGAAIRNFETNSAENVGVEAYESTIELRSADVSAQFNGVIAKRNAQMVAKDLSSATDPSNAVNVKEGGVVTLVGTRPGGSLAEAQGGLVIDDAGGALFMGDNGPSHSQFVSAHLSTDQSASASTFLKVPYDTEDDDPNGDFDTSTGEWTCPANGRYEIEASVQVAGNADQDLYQATINNNGTTISQTYRPNSGTQFLVVPVSVREQLSAGDVIDVKIKNVNSGLTVKGAEAGTTIEITRVA